MPIKNNNSINLIKVPNKIKPVIRQQVFPRMPRLYLELLENKSKIKQELVNKEYIPIDIENNNAPSINTNNHIDYKDSDSYKQNTENNENKDSYKQNTENNEKKDSYKQNTENNENKDSYKQNTENTENKDSYKQNKEQDLEKKLDLILSDDSDSDESINYNKVSKNKQQKNLSPASSFSELSIDEIRDNKPENDNKDTNNKKSDYKDNYSSDSSDDLSVRLKELLDNGSSVSGSPKSAVTMKSNKYSRHRDFSGHSVINPGAHGDAPTLSELERKGGYIPKKEFRDLNQSNFSEQQEENLKRELLFKFDLLKKSYPQATVPDFSIHTDLNTLQQSYDDTVRRLSLDSSVENYKTYLIYGFMGAEFVLGNFLGFDMQGFTQQQIVSMNSYEKLLIELGEKSYVPSGSKWPVEVRLLFMIIMNAAFFIISKMIMKKTGANLMGMINNMSGTGSSSPNNTKTSTQPKKRKMKGPNIDLGDIPDLDN